MLIYNQHTELVQVCNGAQDRYRFGFNGKEKDNELKGLGNSLDYGARMYDSRLGRWMSPDNIMKGYLSSYQYGKDNPIIYIDPDGNTEYYYNGKWVGTDGTDNNLIGIVKSKEVSKQMKKSEYKYPNELKNGSNSPDAFIIDADVLKTANKILDLSLTKKGANREFGTGLNKDENGKYQMIKEGIVEGKPVEHANQSAEVEFPQAEVDIHSHTTGSEIINDKPWSASASEPSEVDLGSLEKTRMFIIVGKEGKATGARDKAIDGSLSPVRVIDSREDVINIYDKDNKTYNKDNVLQPVQKIDQGDASKILKDYEKRK